MSSQIGVNSDFTWVGFLLLLSLALGWLWIIGPKLPADEPLTLEASFVDPSGLRMTVELRALDRRGEYYRTLEVYLAGRQPYRWDLFPDSGGYSQTNLYAKDGKYYLRGFFDTWEVLPKTQQAYLYTDKPKTLGTYLGTFKFIENMTWRFIPAKELAETPLNPKGR